MMIELNEEQGEECSGQTEEDWGEGTYSISVREDRAGKVHKNKLER